MRTDSTRVSNDALSAVRQFIAGQYGKSYVPNKPNTYRSKKGTQDAHEAIRPTAMEYAPERVRRFLRRDALQLYSLIWDRFLASQMVPALFDQTVFEIPVREAGFRATGQQIKFDGFMKVYIEGRDDRATQTNGRDEEEAEDEDSDNEGMLADLQKGDSLKLLSRDLKKAAYEMRDVKRQEVPTDITCDKCGALMVVKWGRNGEFLACPRYPECKNTKNFKRHDNGEIHIAKEEPVNELCEQCGRPMQLR